MDKNIPLVELTVNLEDEDTGVYAISFVDSPATEVDWYAFNNEKDVYKEHLKFLEENFDFTSIGIPAEELTLIGDEFQPTVPRGLSPNQTTYLYRYGARDGQTDVRRDTRGFCRTVIAANRYFTAEDIRQLNNPGQGPNGSDRYNILRYRGGLNCRHVWRRYIYDPENKTVKRDSSWSEAQQPFPVPRYNPQFSNQKFKGDDVKQMITGPVMLADTPIYRYQEGVGEYNVIFRPDAIMDMMKKYMSSDMKDNVNEQHNSNRVVEGVYLVESFILDDRMDLNGTYKNLPKGTWMGTFYIEDKEYYNELVNNPEFNGFSLEGIFDETVVPEEVISEHLYSKIQDILDDINLTDEEIYDKIKKILH